VIAWDCSTGGRQGQCHGTAAAPRGPQATDGAEVGGYRPCRDGGLPRGLIVVYGVSRDLKKDRLNKARQLREQKREEQYLQRRVGEDTFDLSL
jgi:hypothetical protein